MPEPALAEADSWFVVKAESSMDNAKKLRGRLESKRRFFRNRKKKKIPAPISAPRPRTVPKTMGSTGGPEEFGVVPLVGVVVGLEMLAEG